MPRLPLLALRLAAALAPIAVAAPSVGAQPAEREARPRAAPAATGWVDGFQRWPTRRAERDASVSGATQRVLAATADRLVDIVAASPAVSAPPDTICVGIEGYVEGTRRPVLPVPGSTVRFGADLVVPGRRAGGTTCGEGYDVTVRANDPGYVLRGDEIRPGGNDRPPLRDRAGRVLYHGPHAVTQVNGATKYHGRGWWFVILTRGDALPFRTVTVEDYLLAYADALEELRAALRAEALAVTGPDTAAGEARIRAWQVEMRRSGLQQVADLERQGMREHAARVRATLDTLLVKGAEAQRIAMRAQQQVVREIPAQVARADSLQRRLVEAVHAELASLSPAERAAPACWGVAGRKPAYRVPCSDPWADQVVTTNDDFLDPALPPEAVQIVVAATKSGNRGENRGIYEWRQRVLDGIDYQGLRALLAP